jgi:hypothetical protein
VDFAQPAEKAESAIGCLGDDLPKPSSSLLGGIGTYLCVRSILSLPLSCSCFPPAPAILPSSDCAYVRVTNGRVPGCLGGADSEWVVRVGLSKKDEG